MRNSGTNPSQRNHIHLEIELLSAYIDGEVTPDEATRVERHLRVCGSCVEELESLRWTVNLLHEIPPVPVPRSFVIRPGDLEPVPARWRFTPPDWLFNTLQWATVATAVLVILVLAVDFLNVDRPVAPALMEVAQSEQPAPAAKAVQKAEDTEIEKKVAPLTVVTVEAEQKESAELASGSPELPAPTGVLEQAFPALRAEAPAGQPEIGAYPEAVPPASVQREEPPQLAEGQIQGVAPYEPPVAPETAERALPAPRPPNRLRLAGIGLTGLFVVLLGLTLWTRRRQLP